MFEDYPRNCVCTECAAEFAFPPDFPLEDYSCECGGDFKVVGYQTNLQVCVTGKIDDFVHDPTDPRSTIPSLGRHVGRGADAQEKLYKKIIDGYRLRAKRKARDMGRKSDSDFRMLGSVPRELAMARMNQYGKDYWSKGGKDALKRDGLCFED